MRLRCSLIIRLASFRAFSALSARTIASFAVQASLCNRSSVVWSTSPPPALPQNREDPAEAGPLVRCSATFARYGRVTVQLVTVPLVLFVNVSRTASFLSFASTVSSLVSASRFPQKRHQRSYRSLDGLCSWTFAPSA